jgi:hypothetical protein
VIGDNRGTLGGQSSTTAKSQGKENEKLRITKIIFTLMAGLVLTYGITLGVFPSLSFAVGVGISGPV